MKKIVHKKNNKQKLLLLILLTLIAFILSCSNKIKVNKIVYYYNTYNFKMLKKTLDAFNPKDNDYKAYKKITKINYYITIGNFQKALEIINKYNPDRGKLHFQLSKLICLDNLNMKKELKKEIGIWYEIKSNKFLRTFSAQYIDLSFIYYKLGNYKKAFELLNKYYAMKDWSKPVVTYELYKLDYFYDKSNLEECMNILNAIESLKRDTNDKRINSIFNDVNYIKINLWYSLINERLGNYEKAKEYYISTIKKKKDFEKKVKNHIDIKYFYRPTQIFYPSKKILLDFEELTNKYSA